MPGECAAAADEGLPFRRFARSCALSMTLSVGESGLYGAGWQGAQLGKPAPDWRQCRPDQPTLSLRVLGGSVVQSRRWLLPQSPILSLLPTEIRYVEP